MLLLGCGFHLRGSGSGEMLPASLTTIRLVSPGAAANAPLTVAVRDALMQAGAQIVQTGDAPTLTLVGETTSTRVASVRITTAKANEYLLLYTATFRLDGPQAIAPQTIRLQRDYSFDPTQVIAKEQQERELLRDMRRDAAQQIVRRLARASAAPSSPAPAK